MSDEFAFDLPLQLPEEAAAREAYALQLVEYAELMTPLVQAVSEDELQPLLHTLGPFVEQLEQLWPADRAPAQVVALSSAVRARNAHLNRPGFPGDSVR